MSKTFNDLAITIKRTDIKESDRLFVFYTRGHGRVDAIARGVKKINSKMAGHLEPFGIVQLMIARGKTTNQVAGAARQKDFASIKDDLLKIYLTDFALEVVEALTKPEHPDKNIYDLLFDFLILLDNTILDKKNKAQLLLLAHIFSFKLLGYLGFSMDLQSCVKCKNKLTPNGNYFNARKGGVVCSACNGDHQELTPVSKEVIKVMRLAQEKKLDFFIKLRVSRQLVKELDHVMFLYLSELLEWPLKTREILERIFKK